MSDPSAGLAGVLRSVEEHARKGRLPPVHAWNPALCEGIEMRIDAKGRWYFMGSPIGRERMVRLFSTVLRRDPDGRHYLVTPAEKILVRVERTPFLVVRWEARGGDAPVVSCTTDVGDSLDIGPEHPLTLGGQGGERFPQVEVRDGLMAAIHRNCYYQMIDWAQRRNGEGVPRLRSCGMDWPLG